MRTNRKKEGYIAPAMVIYNVRMSRGMLTDQSLPVDPGEEGDQEQAEIKDVEWGNLWDEQDLWKNEGAFWE